MEPNINSTNESDECNIHHTCSGSRRVVLPYDHVAVAKHVLFSHYHATILQSSLVGF